MQMVDRMSQAWTAEADRTHTPVMCLLCSLSPTASRATKDGSDAHRALCATSYLQILCTVHSRRQSYASPVDRRVVVMLRTFLAESRVCVVD